MPCFYGKLPARSSEGFWWTQRVVAGSEGRESRLEIGSGVGIRTPTPEARARGRTRAHRGIECEPQAEWGLWGHPDLQADP